MFEWVNLIRVLPTCPSKLALSSSCSAYSIGEHFCQRLLEQLSKNSADSSDEHRFLIIIPASVKNFDEPLLKPVTQQWHIEMTIALSSIEVHVRKSEVSIHVRCLEMSVKCFVLAIIEMHVSSIRIFSLADSRLDTIHQALSGRTTLEKRTPAKNSASQKTRLKARMSRDVWKLRIPNKNVKQRNGLPWKKREHWNQR